VILRCHFLFLLVRFEVRRAACQTSGERHLGHRTNRRRELTTEMSGFTSVGKGSYSPANPASVFFGYLFGRAGHFPNWLCDFSN